MAPRGLAQALLLSALLLRAQGHTALPEAEDVAPPPAEDAMDEADLPELTPATLPRAAGGNATLLVAFVSPVGSPDSALLHPVLHEMHASLRAAGRRDVAVAYADVATHRELLRLYGLRAVPTLAVLPARWKGGDKAPFTLRYHPNTTAAEYLRNATRVGVATRAPPLLTDASGAQWSVVAECAAAARAAEDEMRAAAAARKEASAQSAVAADGAQTALDAPADASIDSSTAADSPPGWYSGLQARVNSTLDALEVTVRQLQHVRDVLLPKLRREGASAVVRGANERQLALARHAMLTSAEARERLLAEMSLLLDTTQLLYEL